MRKIARLLKPAYFLMTPVLAGCLITACGGSPNFEEVRKWEKGKSRVYAIYTTVQDMEQIKEYARKKKWEKGGTTRVLFYSDRVLVPATSHLNPEKSLNLLPRTYRESWIANYERHPDGTEKFTEAEGL